MFDCLTVTKPTLLLLQDHWSSGNQWGECTCLIVSQWQNQQCCFDRTTDPFVISEMTVHVWLSHSDKTNNVFLQDNCLFVTKPTQFLLQDRWSSGNRWVDCTLLIVPQWKNQQCCFYRTTDPLVISEVTVYVWLSHSDKTINIAFTGRLVLCLSVRWLYMYDCFTVTKPTLLFFYRTTGPLLISEVTVHVWLCHSDKTNNVAFTGPLVHW